MTTRIAQSREAAPQLTALNGIRFFAVFHIFLHHLWSVRYESQITKGQFCRHVRRARCDAGVAQQSVGAWLPVDQLFLSAVGIHPGVSVLGAGW
jgi:hypothetical protein